MRGGDWSEVQVDHVQEDLDQVWARILCRASGDKDRTMEFPGHHSRQFEVHCNVQVHYTLLYPSTIHHTEL